MTELTRKDHLVFHFRIKQGQATEPKAGATVVFLPRERRFGVALCCYKDRYCKRWGRKIATERAQNGSQSRIQNKRFTSSPNYSGVIEMGAIRASAQALAYYAAERVGNPFVSQGSLFIGEDERSALRAIGLLS